MIRGLRRSSLYVPCDRESMIVKAAGLPADMVLLNLEDGVSRHKKDEARETLVRMMPVIDFGPREIVVRINALRSETGRRDLAASIPLRPDGICLPKVETEAEVQQADAALLECEIACGLEEGSIRLHAMIESARGVLNADAIAAASPRMASLIFGSADYCADVRCRPGPDRWELLLALQRIVLAARAAGIDAIDAPCFDYRNTDLLRRESEQARRLGMDGKNALHPAQLDLINRIFSAAEDEIDWARRVLQELNRAEAQGRALTTVEGQLVDDPHRAAAQRVLTRAQMQQDCFQDRRAAERPDVPVKLWKAYAETDESFRRLQAFLAGMTTIQATFRPTPSEWSAGEVVHHLVLSQTHILRGLERRLAEAEENGLAPDPGPDRAVEGLETRAALEGRRFQAPDGLRPEPGRDLERSLRDLAAQQAALKELLPRLGRRDLSRLGFNHPFLGDLNLYQWIQFWSAHMLRHLKQIEKVRQHPDFPVEGGSC